MRFNMAIICLIFGCLGISKQTIRADVGLKVQTALQTQSGGNLSLDKQAINTRTAFQIRPTLTWTQSTRRTSSDLRVTSTADLPAHTSQGAINNLSGDWRFRYAYSLRTLLETRLHIGQIAFDDQTLWRTRTRLSGDVGISTTLISNVYLLSNYTYATSHYKAREQTTTTNSLQIDPSSMQPSLGRAIAGSVSDPTENSVLESAVTPDKPNRQDHRHRMRGALLWTYRASWLTGGGHLEHNQASVNAYKYQGAQLYLGGGLQKRGWSINLQTSHEWRAYQLPDNNTSIWRALWVFAETAWQVKPWVKIFTNIQKEYSYQNGKQAFAPWTFTSAGLQFSIPIQSKKIASKPTPKPLTPHQTPSGWVFRYQGAQAKSVHLIGTFSGWNPQGYALKKDPKTHVWEITIPLKPGVYEYAFIINGSEWTVPQQAAMYVDDGFGNRNGVLVVEETTELTFR